jgi:hypothetical protein
MINQEVFMTSSIHNSAGIGAGIGAAMGFTAGFVLVGLGIAYDWSMCPSIFGPEIGLLGGALSGALLGTIYYSGVQIKEAIDNGRSTTRDHVFSPEQKNTGLKDSNGVFPL